MKDSTFKQTYAFTNLGMVMFWGIVLLAVVIRAFLVAPGVGDVVAAAGVGALMGALIVWNTNINQHYYRKGRLIEPDSGTTEGSTVEIHTQ